MKGDITIKLLEIAEEFPGYVADMAEMYLCAGYGASMSRMDFEFNKLRRRRELSVAARREKYKIHKLFHKLKKDGLIVGTRDGDGICIAKLTSSGRRKLKELQRQRRSAPSITSYDGKTADRFVIVAFDVPEYERKKRNWLRGALGAIGLKMIQQSVWIGKVKIPADFIDDLGRLKMSDYVEILEVTKTGSLKHLV